MFTNEEIRYLLLVLQTRIEQDEYYIQMWGNEKLPNGKTIYDELIIFDALVQKIEEEYEKLIHD